MNKFYLVLCSLFFCIGIQAQRITVTGIVSVSSGEKLPGVSVKVKGDRIGAVTSTDGSYNVAADGSATLVFSFIGYNSIEVPVNNHKVINVKLKESSTELNEVVISVPYGTAKKQTFTGSAASVDSKIIANSEVSSISKALEGTVAGLQSFSSSGQPGSDATILIRGVGSVNASNDPLYVVDGVPYAGTLSSLSSSDIESITVLKDAAAAALYGSRAANGVIMINTKQGSKNASPTIDFSAKYGFSSRAVADYKQINTNQYFQLQWEAMKNGQIDQGSSAQAAAQYATQNLVGTLGINPYGSKYPQPVDLDGNLVSGAQPLWNDSWYDALTQSAHYTDINLNISGGSTNSKYFLSGGYLDNQGSYIQSGFKRYSLRANITSDVKKWLQVGLNLTGSHSQQEYPTQEDSSIENIVLFALSIPSFYPVYERNMQTGAYLLDDKGKRIYDYGNYRPTSYAGYNLAGSLPHDKNEVTHDAASLRTYILVSILKGLNYKMSLNVDYDSKFNHTYQNPLYGYDALSGGSVSKSNTRTTGMTFNNVVNYDKTFEDRHNLKVMGGQEYYEYNTSNFGGTRTQVIMDGMYEPDAASNLTAFSGNSDQYKLLSFFGSAEYSYNKKYFLSTSIRTDGSSRFASNHRWGTFWSAGASWQIMREKFLEKAYGSWLSNLVLRASYGAQGNDNIGYYAYQALYSIENNLGKNGLIVSRLATPNLKWETNLNTNIGLDFGFWDNRLLGTVEYFERNSKDLLFSKDLVPSSGFSSMDANLGKVKNYGWEFTLAGTPILTKDWKWKLSVNATTYKNKIVSMPTAEMWSGSKKWVKGGSLFDFYLPKWAGVNESDGNPQWYLKDGKTKTEDYSSLTINDKVKCGNSLPNVTGGIQSDLSYKRFSLSTLFSYSIGGKIYNGDKLFLLGQSGDGDSWSVDMLKRWTPQNRKTDIPRLTENPQSSWTSSSSRWLVNRSYLRLKNITLTYGLPSILLKHLDIKDASIYVQGENLLTLSKEQGLDPEQPYSGATYYRYPAMRTVSFGINIKL